MIEIYDDSELKKLDIGQGKNPSLFLDPWRSPLMIKG
jgi:hypothetical protein